MMGTSTPRREATMRAEYVTRKEGEEQVSVLALNGDKIILREDPQTEAIQRDPDSSQEGDHSQRSDIRLTR